MNISPATPPLAFVTQSAPRFVLSPPYSGECLLTDSECPADSALFALSLCANILRLRDRGLRLRRPWNQTANCITKKNGKKCAKLLMHWEKQIFKNNYHINFINTEHQN